MNRSTHTILLISLGIAVCGCERGSTEPTKETVAERKIAPAATPPKAKVKVTQQRDKAAVAVDQPAAGGKVADEPEKPDDAVGTQGTTETAKPAPKRATSDTGTEQQTAAGGLSIKRLVVAGAIEQREPVTTQTIRADGKPVYAFVELRNDSDSDRNVIVTFERSDGTKVGRVPLKVPAKQRRWRTWGRTQLIRKTGDWEAVVRTKGGEEIGRVGFKVAQG